MPQDDKSSRPDKQQREAEPIEAGREEMNAGTKSAEARIWAAANKFIRETNEPFEEEQ